MDDEESESVVSRLKDLFLLRNEPNNEFPRLEPFLVSLDGLSDDRVGGRPGGRETDDVDDGEEDGGGWWA